MYCMLCCIYVTYFLVLCGEICMELAELGVTSYFVTKLHNILLLKHVTK